MVELHTTRFERAHSIRSTMESDERGTGWLGFALQEAFKQGLTDARELLGHATPEVLVAQLPRELTSQLLAGALKTGRLTPESLLEVAPPGALAEHLEPSVLWSCLSNAAETAHLTRSGGTASAAGRRWMGALLGRALKEGLITADEVVRQVPPHEWVKDAPPQVVASLMAAGLQRGTFDAKLVLTLLTPELMAEHLSAPLLWSCIATTARRTFQLPEPSDAAALDSAKVEPVMVRSAPVEKRPDAPDSWDETTIGEEQVLEEMNPSVLSPEPAAAKKARVAAILKR